MQIIRAPRRTAAVAAGVLAVVLLVCGGLFTHPVPSMAPMPSMATMTMPAVSAMDMAVSAAAAVHTNTDAGTGPAMGKSPDGGGCSVSGEDCPLASAWAPAGPAAPATNNLAVSAAWSPPPVAAGPAGPVPHRACAQPRAPDPDSLCVSRT